ncbi:hypothetical protein AVEN_175070-1 [Araneus ventricosus]|uniref:Uncharacterized protein n=1 Tax=Araneus ventricosus TaxID=182803 RepID=A0A4Y2MYD3_ARAVE|nr:hypothetical protein AVEN_175070-1 [Araneus ventricosus]
MGASFHTFIAAIFEHMTTVCTEKKEIQCTMPQNVGLPSPGISKLLRSHLNYSGCKTFSRTAYQEPDLDFICDENNLIIEDNH